MSRRSAFDEPTTTSTRDAALACTTEIGLGQAAATPERESVKVLLECIELQRKKSRDYQHPSSGVTQAMHYRRGIDTLHDTLQGKLYRAQSLIESGESANFESLEDTYKDLINYASFCVAWLRGGVPGQDSNRDMFNRKK